MKPDRNWEIALNSMPHEKTTEQKTNNAATKINNYYIRPSETEKFLHGKGHHHSNKAGKYRLAISFYPLHI